ncbi:MED7 protein-domain-containing protein [Podospora didyma]|uniref:Mediator of RNA polymerase II transcription subunit 7 n=1 Tax=Podospora didyma TaxID=330526 RepID=A0AAE0TVC9_9PEZI|nr:MED7 protein-domain-containing protein [Podospora didyma]
MAQMEEDDNAKAAALYPDPPGFWHDFSDENIARFDSLKQEFAEQNGLDSDTVLHIPDTPEDLIGLQPPLEPADGKWKIFNIPSSLEQELQSLEEGGIQRLGPLTETDRDGKHVDRAFELKRLAKSLLLNYLELVGVMPINPAHGLEKVQDLKTLLLNFHHILNEYRPHQAREQLIQLMQAQLDSKRAETAAIRDVVDKAKRALEGLGSMGIPAVETPEDETGGGEVNGLEAPPAADGTNDVKNDRPYWERESVGWALIDEDFS